MIAVSLLSLYFGVAVSVEEVREVPADTAERVAAMVADEISRTTGVPPVLDHRLWSSCAEGARCLAEIRARTGEQDLLLLRIFGGPLSIQLVAEKTGDATAPRTVDLPKRDEGQWRSLIAGTIATMFPAKATPQIDAETPPIEPPRSAVPDWVDWILLGAGVASCGVATAFAVSSGRARAAAEEEYLEGSTFDRYDRRRREHQNVAIASGVAGGALIGGSIGLMIFD